MTYRMIFLSRILLFVGLVTIAVPQRAHGCPLPPPTGSLKASSIGDPIPSTGAHNLLILLVDFSDEPGRFTQAEVYERFFGAWGFSAYFAQVSHGQLAYSGGVVGISGGSPVTNGSGVAYVRLPNPKSYYSASVAGTNVGDFPRNLFGIYYHALLELEAAGFDFSPYADSEKVLQNVIVVFAGNSSVASGDSNDLQPTAVSLSYFFDNGAYENSAGYRFKNFTFCPERQGEELASIGVCVHEHGHNLGLPDLYDLSFTSGGIGFAGLMGYGTHGGVGVTPFHLSAFSKVKLGWVGPTTAPSSGTVTLPPVQEGGQILKFAASSNATEYFLLENRQARGFDTYLSGAGLCPGVFLWHVDETVYNTHLLQNLVNSPAASGGPAHPAVRLVEADGGADLIQAPISYGECDDTFVPGSRWGAGGEVPATYWGGGDSGFAFTVLSESGGTVTLQIDSSYVAPTPTPSPTATPPPQPTATPTPVPVPLKGKIVTTVNKRAIVGALELRGKVRKADRVKRLVVLKVRATGETFTTTTTNLKGVFKFRKIPPGTYTVTIENLATKVKVKRVKRNRRK